MDRDEICFFNLISLIEEYGFNSVDYLYYKTRETLVAIQWDTDVMQMLQENESRKKVSLFVTRQRIAVMSPTKSNKEPNKSARNKTKGKKGTKKKQHLNVIHTEAQYADEIDQQHDNEIDEAPDVNDWRKVKKDSAETILQCIQVQLENIIDKQPELAQNSEGRVAWEGDALQQVLGKEKPGQVHGMGLLPVPNQVYGRTTRHFKDINIATIDGSSSDVETHMLEEIKQLKEHARNQDKRIDKDEEPSKANCISTDHGNIQNHAVYSNRKCQGNAHHNEFPHQEVESSSPECSTNDYCGQKENQQVVLQDATMADQVAAHDKAARSKRSKYVQPVPIKVGSTVLLKTANYRNKATVAYATILSSSPKADVGGVEIGKQFYKVRINHPIEKNEPLVRPIAGYKTIGDAHAKGTPIAWPSVCVCYH
ncbi:hypothetical protein HU200_038339 [Digitaria exilis]|uniref:Transposase Tnp1/En/Spm-like domain-containing protein n=1 Tax=Digitaria exilis TaxID=1010633 RepID=A0A835BCT1_9POAL|nr:hypothetical protein HU200_038339 [Digitaria exilis]